jgi:HlyD family secretion protein
MIDNDPHNDSNKLTSKKVFFAGMIIVLGLLVYMLVKDIKRIPSGNPEQDVSQTTPQAPTPPASGTHDVPVAFRVSGRITNMFFAEHAKVQQGDILASLDKMPFEEALTAARAQLQVAQAEYNRSAHLPTSTFNAIEAARANVETAQHAYDAAHLELEKRRALLVAGELDNVYNDDVQNDHDAELNLERTRRELAHEEDAANNADRDADKASVQAAEANLAIAETNLADTQLLAPAAGIVASRASEVGATISEDTPVYILSVPKTPTP